MLRPKPNIFICLYIKVFCWISNTTITFPGVCFAYNNDASRVWMFDFYSCGDGGTDRALGSRGRRRQGRRGRRGPAAPWTWPLECSQPHCRGHDRSVQESLGGVYLAPIYLFSIIYVARVCCNRSYWIDGPICLLRLTLALNACGLFNCRLINWSLSRSVRVLRAVTAKDPRSLSGSGSRVSLYCALLSPVARLWEEVLYLVAW